MLTTPRPIHRRPRRQPIRPPTTRHTRRLPLHRTNRLQRPRTIPLHTLRSRIRQLATPTSRLIRTHQHPLRTRHTRHPHKRTRMDGLLQRNDDPNEPKNLTRIQMHQNKNRWHRLRPRTNDDPIPTTNLRLQPPNPTRRQRLLHARQRTTPTRTTRTLQNTLHRTTHQTTPMARLGQTLPKITHTHRTRRRTHRHHHNHRTTTTTRNHPTSIHRNQTNSPRRNVRHRAMDPPRARPQHRILAHKRPRKQRRTQRHSTPRRCLLRPTSLRNTTHAPPRTRHRATIRTKHQHPTPNTWRTTLLHSK